MNEFLFSFCSARVQQKLAPVIVVVDVQTKVLVWLLKKVLQAVMPSLTEMFQKNILIPKTHQFGFGGSWQLIKSWISFHATHLEQ